MNIAELVDRRIISERQLISDNEAQLAKHTFALLDEEVVRNSKDTGWRIPDMSGKFTNHSTINLPILPIQLNTAEGWPIYSRFFYKKEPFLASQGYTFVARVTVTEGKDNAPEYLLATIIGLSEEHDYKRVTGVSLHGNTVNEDRHIPDYTAEYSAIIDLLSRYRASLEEYKLGLGNYLLEV